MFTSECLLMYVRKTVQLLSCNAKQGLCFKNMVGVLDPGQG